MQISNTGPNPNAPYFNKGKRYYKIGFYLFLWTILYTQLAKVLPQHPIVAVISALLVVVPVLAEFALVPLAIANILKSYRYKEPFNKYRMFYLIVLIIMQALLLIFILAIAGDLRSL